jgi:FMN phosphatase YigB (HAD superfamily)
MSDPALPKCVLFDLGGVIIDVDMGGVVAPFTAANIDTSEPEAWYRSGAAQRFEIGQIGPAEFGEAIVGELGLDCTAQQFLERYEDIHKGQFSGAPELLDRLSSHTHLACFSNTTELHWAWLCRNYQTDQRFKTCILSFELGYRKPDAAAFLAAAGCLPFEPGDIVFFDDRPENVEGAKAAGFDAHLVYGPEPVAAILGLDWGMT